MKRLLTAAIGVPLALAAVFRFPSSWFLILVAVVVELAVLEYARMTRRWAPQAPLNALLVLVPLTVLWLAPELLPGRLAVLGLEHAAAGVLVLTAGIGALVVGSRIPLEQGLPAVGILCFGSLYLGLPLASLYHLHRIDPWVLFLLLAIVWLGDTAAYYCGTAWGRHRLAPRISPKKSWEGAGASLAAALLVAAVWGQWRLGRVGVELLLVAGATSVAAQLGDLVESLIKRGAGIKDSGNLLPGHGGLLDRIDALLLAAPVMLLAVWLLAPGTLVP